MLIHADDTNTFRRYRHAFSFFIHFIIFHADADIADFSLFIADFHYAADAITLFHITRALMPATPLYAISPYIASSPSS